jgi:RimJ/RimL family protein N-acetyltransferase
MPNSTIFCEVALRQTGFSSLQLASVDKTSLDGLETILKNETSPLSAFTSPETVLAQVQDCYRTDFSAGLALIARLAENDQAVGCATIINAEISLYIASAWRGFGLGTALASGCCEIGFRKLGLTSVYALVSRENLACKSALEKAGLRYAGLSSNNKPFQTALVYKKLEF